MFAVLARACYGLAVRFLGLDTVGGSWPFLQALIRCVLVRDAALAVVMIVLLFRRASRNFL